MESGPQSARTWPSWWPGCPPASSNQWSAPPEPVPSRRPARPPPPPPPPRASASRPRPTPSLAWKKCCRPVPPRRNRPTRSLLLFCRRRRGRALRQAEDEHRAAQRITQLEVAAAGHRNELLATAHEAHRGAVAAGTAVEGPDQRARGRVVGVEVPVAFTGEGEAAGGRETAAHHRLIDLLLPGDLAGGEVHRREQAVLGLAGDGDERGAEPEPALFPRRGVGDVVHRLMQAGRERIAQLRA